MGEKKGLTVQVFYLAILANSTYCVRWSKGVKQNVLVSVCN